MYTSVESRPEAHPTKRTTFVRLDGERKITIGVEDGTAPRVDTQYNFSGLVTDYEIPGAEPNIAYVHTIGDKQLKCRIAVRMYHGADATGENLPIGGEYGYAPDKGWHFWSPRTYKGSLDQLLDRFMNATDISQVGDVKILDIESQEFPVVLWNITDISRAGALPGENIEPSLITDAMIREQRDSQAISEARGINYDRCYSNFDEFLTHLDEICAAGKYLFRGESEHYNRGVVSSKLSRAVHDDFNQHGKKFDPSIDFLRSVIQTQKHEIQVAKWLQSDRSYSLGSATRSGGFVKDFPQNIEDANFHQEDLQLLAEIQHYGGITFLVDFTKDLNVALFFACKDNLDKDGRLMLLPTEHEGDMWTRISPSNPFDRYSKQKSVLVVPRLGCLLPNGSGSPAMHNSQCVMFNVPKRLKGDILEHLAEKNITHEGLDLYGGYERIPDEIREYIEEQKSREQNSFVVSTIFVPVVRDTIVQVH